MRCWRYQLILCHARHNRDAHVRRIQGDVCRIVSIKQVTVGVIDMPLSLLIDTQQHNVEPALINRIDDVFGRLQRHFVFC